jgi:hypothetical protein
MVLSYTHIRTMGTLGSTCTDGVCSVDGELKMNYTFGKK